MRLPLSSLQQLDLLSEALDASGADLRAILGVLIDDLAAVVPALSGLTIVLPVVGVQVPVRLTVRTGAAVASMLLPLHLFTTLPDGSVIIFYAGQPEAFADLAAYSRAAYGLDGQVVVDEHLQPLEDDVNMVDGVTEQSDINQAIGVLIERGHLPELARAELEDRAAATNSTVHETALHVLGGLANVLPTSSTAEKSGKAIDQHGDDQA